MFYVSITSTVNRTYGLGAQVSAYLRSRIDGLHEENFQMTSNDKKSPLVGLDVDAIIKASIRKNPVIAEVKAKLDEAYVAEPKPFKQVSELVSQKTKNAHVEIYKKYVETLNEVSAALDTADRTVADSKHSEYRSLKLDESYNLNSVWLHELYFANCFDPHSEVYMDSLAYIELEKNFGTFDDFQKDFIACALGVGTGWAVCGYHMFLRKFINTVVTNHSNNVMVGIYPIIVVDMHEHAYFRDYLTDKKSYLISQMRELNWAVVEERMIKARAIAQILK